MGKLQDPISTPPWQKELICDETQSFTSRKNHRHGAVPVLKSPDKGTSN